MAIINKDGKAISYCCEELIEELKHDIAEFGGDTIVTVWCKEHEGVILYTNYDFIDDELPTTESELADGEYFKQMTMTELLAVMKKQNEIL